MDRYSYLLHGQNKFGDVLALVIVVTTQVCFGSNSAQTKRPGENSGQLGARNIGARNS